MHVGIDDLGTGHSGLSYPLKLGVDFIKIDKIFVYTIDTERYSSTIIEAMVGLARDMRMEITRRASRPSSRCSTCARGASAGRKAKCSRLPCRGRHS